MGAGNAPYEMPSGSDGVKREPKWYQTSIRELLWITALVALAMSLLTTFGIKSIWSTMSTLALFAFPIIHAVVRFRAACRKHGLWDLPDAGSEEDCQHEHRGRAEPPLGKSD